MSRPRRRWREGDRSRETRRRRPRPGLRAGSTCREADSVCAEAVPPRPRHDPRQEPCAAIPHARIRAGGRPKGRSLPRPVFPERHNVAINLLDPAVAAEDLEGGSEAGEDGISTDDPLGSEPWHPFVNTTGKISENVAPITDFVVSKGAIGVFSWA